MSFLTKLFGRPKREIKELTTEPIGKKAPSKPEPTGTTLRPPGESTRVTKKKPAPELTALEMAEKQDWEVKTLPVWKAGDVILETYEVEDVISGGMGHVYIANHKNWNVKLAIKSPNEMMLSQRDFFARILREANSWTELGLHPNIAYCYYVRNIEDVPHIFVEYVDGGNLRQWIEDGKCIDYRVNLDLAIQFCHGMEFAHSKEMIHRDIKPENILITKDGVLKITDFGLVRGGEALEETEQSGQNDRPTEDSSLTVVGAEMGTWGYMSPEQKENPHGVDERTDIFAFGICLYEMFCGNRPYEITFGPRQEPPDPVSISGDESFPREIGAVLARAVQWEPDERYKNFTEIRLKFCCIYHDLFEEESPYAELELLDLEAGGLNNQGVSYFDLGRKEDAVSCWDKVLQINQFHPEATYNLSLMQWRAGNIDDVEVLNRVKNCGKTPTVNKTALNEMIASIHCERFDPNSAKRLLTDNEDIYHAILRGKDPDQLQGLQILREHSDEINSVAVSPDGKTCLSGGGVYGYGSDCSLRVWDLESFECIRLMGGHSRKITTVAITPDGRRAATGSCDDTLRVWKIKTGKCIRAIKEREIIHSVTVAKDGRRAITGGSGTVKVWRIDKGKPIRNLRSGKYQRSILSVVVSEDSQFVVSGRSSGNIGLSKIKSGEFIGQLEGHAGAVNTVRIIGVDKFVISGSEDNTLKLWNMENRECIRTFKGHTGGVRSVAVFSQNKFAVSGSRDKTLKIWDLNSGQCVRTFEGHTDEIASLDIFAEGRFAISASKDRTLRVWKLPRTTIFRAEPKLAVPADFTVLKQKQHQQKLSFNNALKLYRKGRFKQSYALLLEAWKETGYSDSEIISELYANLAVKGRISAFAFANRMTSLQGHSAPVLSFAMPENGNLAISGSDDNTICVWDVETSKCKRILKGHRKGVASVAVLDSGKFALSGSWDKTIKLWNIDTGECTRTLKGHAEGINSVALIGDGRFAISCSWDKTARIWELETGECIRVLKGHTHSVHCVAVNRSGKFSLSASKDETIRIWNLETNRCIWTLQGHAGAITTATFLKDGRSVLSGSEDKTLKLWDLKKGECMATLHGHEDAVSSVDVTCDGRFAMSSGRDMTVRIWDLDEQSCIYSMENQQGGENLTALIGDHRFAAYGNTDNCVNIWRIVWDYTFD